jgi:hypothetical protein
VVQGDVLGDVVDVAIHEKLSEQLLGTGETEKTKVFMSETSTKITSCFFTAPSFSSFFEEFICISKNYISSKITIDFAILLYYKE